MDPRTTRSVMVAVLAVVAVGCGSGNAPTSAPTQTTTPSSTTISGQPVSACDEPVTEPVDPRSVQHVLPGAPEPDYETDPPTSGPHQVGPRISGVVDDPLTRPVQVGILEGGQVIVQYREGEETDIPGLEQLAGDTVVVAPNPDLPSPVVATAWRTKMTCSGVDLPAIEAFIVSHAGHGPGSDA